MKEVGQLANDRGQIAPFSDLDMDDLQRIIDPKEKYKDNNIYASCQQYQKGMLIRKEHSTFNYCVFCIVPILLTWMGFCRRILYFLEFKVMMKPHKTFRINHSCVRPSPPTQVGGRMIVFEKRPCVWVVDGVCQPKEREVLMQINQLTISSKSLRDIERVSKRIRYCSVEIFESFRSIKMIRSFSSNF